MKTTMLESIFNKFEAYSFIKKRLQQRCFPMNIVIILRTAFLYNPSSGCFWSKLSNT